MHLHKVDIETYMKELSTRVERGECFHCGVKMKAQIQVGRCIYIEPCGCRLGQGQLKQNGKPVKRVDYPVVRNET